jgi:lipoprotein-anchoring transpeptidase ErfK/SrfK
MRKTTEQIQKLAALTGMVMLAAAEAFAQDAAAVQTGEIRRPAGLGDVARRIVISIRDRKLALIENGRVVRVFPTAVGAERTPSPAGSYRIVQRVSNPTWYTKGRIVPPGKANPLGTRWLGLSAKGYGIHGTNNPASIGNNVSHGCIRMRNRDVEQLFDLVAVGDPVELYTERTPDLDAIFGPSEKVEIAVVSGQ